jgi:hypothetical protein
MVEGDTMGDQFPERRKATRVEVAPVTETAPPAESHRHVGDGFVVDYALWLGEMPRIKLSWGVQERYWGSRLLIFHSTTGFHSEDDPDDLGSHGKLIVETLRNDHRQLHLSEGEHFFTFLLRKRGLFGRYLEGRSKPLRIAVAVPSAKLVLSRMDDEIAFLEKDNKRKILPLRLEAERYEARRRLLEEKKRYRRLKLPEKTTTHESDRGSGPKGKVLAFLKTLSDKREILAELPQSPDFQRLSDTEKELVLQEIEARFDPKEEAARREELGSDA